MASRRFTFRFDSREHRQALARCAHDLGVLVRFAARGDGAYDVVGEGPENALDSLALYPRYTDGVVAVENAPHAPPADFPPKHDAFFALFGTLVGILV